MDLLQLFIIVMGLAGQVFVARKHPAGYGFWTAGSIALIVVYSDLHQYGLIGFQAANTGIQLYAMNRWARDRRATLPAGSEPSV